MGYLKVFLVCSSRPSTLLDTPIGCFIRRPSTYLTVQTVAELFDTAGDLVEVNRLTAPIAFQNKHSHVRLSLSCLKLSNTVNVQPQQSQQTTTRKYCNDDDVTVKRRQRAKMRAGLPFPANACMPAAKFKEARPFTKEFEKDA